MGPADVGLLFFLAVIGFVIWLSATRKSKQDALKHEEAMAMIEKGIYEPLPVQEPVYRKEYYLLAGIVLSMVGLAFLLCFAFLTKPDEGFIVAALLFLFPGLGIMGFSRSLAKREEREARNNALQENPPV